MTREFLAPDENVEPPVVIPSADPRQMEIPTFTLPTVGEVITAERTGHTYRIGEQIGQGAFGIVYECVDDWGNELAVKILRPRGLPYEDVRANAVGEIDRLHYLRHPRITFVYDAFEYRYTFYVVVERCHRSLKDLMEIQDFNGAVWIMGIARCLLQAVQYIHFNEMVHQDIHLGNVFWQQHRDELLPYNTANNFKLADLGIAKFANQMNAENTVLADWMRAPEAINVKEFGPMDHRMDIYHCGLLFLSILRGGALTYTEEQVLAGVPREDALQLQPPYNFALEKVLRRHVPYRTSSALELWRDLNSPVT
jgi:serine/threonine-protein kinase